MVTKVIHKPRKKSVTTQVIEKVKKLLNEPTDLWAGVSNIEIKEHKNYVRIDYLTQQGSMSKWKTIEIKK